MTNQGKSRLAELDAFRGLAALWVMLFHFLYRYPRSPFFEGDWPTITFGLPDAPDRYIGELPVYWFFMISGFVIMMSAERSKSASDFLLRRASRLYPAYWACLFLSLAIIAIMTGERPSLWVIFANATMLQEYVLIPHISAVYWSLTVEIGFYLMVAVALALNLLKHRRWLLTIWLAASILYGFMGIPNPIPWPIVKALCLDYAAFFVAGILYYELWKEKGLGPWERALLVASLIAVFLKFALSVALIITLFHGLFLLIALRPVRSLEHPIWLVLGALSYPLYLIHEHLGYLWLRLIPGPFALRFTAAILLTLAAAYFLTRLVDEPARTWLRKRLSGGRPG